MFHSDAFFDLLWFLQLFPWVELTETAVSSDFDMKHWIAVRSFGKQRMMILAVLEAYIVVDVQANEPERIARAFVVTHLRSQAADVLDKQFGHVGIVTVDLVKDDLVAVDKILECTEGVEDSFFYFCSYFLICFCTCFYARFYFCFLFPVYCFYWNRRWCYHELE